MNRVNEKDMNNTLKATSFEDYGKSEEMRKCEYCGKSYKWYDKQIAKIHIHQQVPSCDCLEKIEKQKKENYEKRLKEEIRRKRQAKLFDNSLMTPFFKDKIFSNLDETKEHFAFCYQYAKDFSPETSKGIRMFGNVGTGKTTLLAAICNELMKKGFSCLFTTLSALLDKFSKYAYENAGDVQPLLLWLCSFDFVVLDDIGREAYTEKRKEFVYRIVDALLNYKTVTAVTANPEMLQKLLKTPDWQAIIDRLKDICSTELLFKGESLRGANA